ncbi:hypothetical protein SDRG_00153 [Saprolegnia diclina VS20]|uniref:Uncharacterized protein n=1 Tax=Saprolegnia diclina (strain VS20) TaxID=1156394 RepID=T0SAQ4_SAPDV|nr:hypothetical protein SDRG_00153 [Saprolegnia diclina VS20]EQC42418.1 hypothetical protein SDRG_00153 [Saprolegnia diclina VS20]|eukprot:XP_008603841.1 hypothetical protein SDRG_00153 [Saprolegnia diclina VS20]
MEDLVRELTKQNIALQLALAKTSSPSEPEPALLGPAFAWLHPVKARLSAAEKAKKALRRVLVKAVRRRLLRVAMAFGLWRARSASRPVSKIPVPLGGRRKTAPQPTALPPTAASHIEKTPKELVYTLSKQLDTQRVLVTALSRQKARLEADATAQTAAIASLEASQATLQRQMSRLIKEVQSLRRPVRRDPPTVPPLSTAAQQILKTTRPKFSNQELHDRLDELMEPLDLDPATDAASSSSMQPSPPTDGPKTRFLGRRSSFALRE